MEPMIPGSPRRRRLTPVIVGAVLFSLSLYSRVNAEELASTVRGAHEGMAADEKTDDLGITVPMAPVSFPARRYPASQEFPTGPEVGERLPDFSLPNQNGETIDFHQNRGDSKAIIVFYRSVVW